MSKIKLLPDNVANQIAAGEVVNRPASVIKEMVENAVDAGATLVTVNFRDSGRELIQVIDNGEGMSPADARMAFEKHATSKITSIDDIYALHTFGFRGEALASIAAVADVGLTTRREEDELGNLISIQGGKFILQDVVVSPKGSQFQVKNLFFNIPARRKLLDSSNSEATVIKNEFRRVALCYPDVSFMLYQDDAPIYNLAVSNLKNRIIGVSGKHMTGNLLDVHTDTTIVKIEGFVGRPSAAKKRGAEQYLFVNGRYFESNYIRKAVVQAYDKLIPTGEQPSFFLYLTVDTDKIDVNMHPQKTQVCFSDEPQIWQILNAAVREALAKTGAIPMMDFEDNGGIEIPVFQGDTHRVISEPSSTINPQYNPFDPNSAGRRSAAGFSDFTKSYDISATPNEKNYDRSTFSFIEGLDEQQELGIDGFASDFVGSIPISGGYVATSLGGRLAIVDLSRAREVTLYKRYLMMLGNGSSVGQTLLFPERMVFSGDDITLLGENYDDFLRFGFEYSIIDENTIELSTIPADVAMGDISELFYDMIDAIRDERFDSEELRKERLATILSRSGNTKQLTEGEVRAIVESLEGCKNCSLTPDGRAVVRLIETDEIKKLF